jgi:hypothetical protein
LEKNWGFWKKETFFIGSQDGYNGEFSGKDDVIVYFLSLPESGYMPRFVFKKIDGDWKLFKFIDFSN